METEGIQYSGSKKTVIPRILELIPNNINFILDGCAGTTRVGQALKKSGYNIDSNDLSEYSKSFGYCYLINNHLDYNEYIKHLNSLSGVNGWLTENYAGDENNGNSEHLGKKRNWLRKNTQKADRVMEEIIKLNLNQTIKSVLITSLILALDKVSNNLGHQVSYLRKWAPRCYLDLELKCPALIKGDKIYNVYQKDIQNIDKKYDLVYLDIPYGANNQKIPSTRVRYNSYYHIWNSICKWDKPELFGAANRRKDSSDKVIGAISQFEDLSYEKVLSSIDKVCRNLNTEYIIFSYNNKSKIEIKDLIDCFNKIGKVKYESFPYKENVQKNMTINNLYLGDNNQNLEYLFLIKK